MRGEEKNRYTLESVKVIDTHAVEIVPGTACYKKKNGKEERTLALARQEDERTKSLRWARAQLTVDTL